MFDHVIEFLKVIIYGEDNITYIMREPSLFGDYLITLFALEDMDTRPEESIQNYEDLLDYKAVYHIFQEVTKLLFYK